MIGSTFFSTVFINPDKDVNTYLHNLIIRDLSLVYEGKSKGYFFITIIL